MAECLDQLLGEVNAAAPGRSKASDGSIGDEDHQSRNSDHNPWCCGWVVTARDFTHDPAGGFDSYEFAEWLRLRCRGDILLNGAREYRVKYIISNRKIASPDDDWAWREYTGDNPHDKHAHVSVDCTGEGGYMDSTDRWGWGETVSLDETVPATGERTLGVCISDVWNAVAVGASGYDPAVALHLNAQLNAMQDQLTDIAEAVAQLTGRAAWGAPPPPPDDPPPPAFADQAPQR